MNKLHFNKIDRGFNYSNGRYYNTYTGLQVSFDHVNKNYIMPNTDGVWKWGIIGGYGVGSAKQTKHGVGWDKNQIVPIYGKSYSLINPKYVPFYRNFAGLPEVNSGQYLIKGSIPLRDINVGRLFAAPLKGNTGGLPFELYQSYDQLMYPANVLIKKPF